jgi:hypothetical protein
MCGPDKGNPFGCWIQSSRKEAVTQAEKIGNFLSPPAAILNSFPERGTTGAVTVHNIVTWLDEHPSRRAGPSEKETHALPAPVATSSGIPCDDRIYKLLLDILRKLRILIQRQRMGIIPGVRAFFNAYSLEVAASMIAVAVRLPVIELLVSRIPFSSSR